MIYNHIATSYEDIADVTVTVYMAYVVAIVASDTIKPRCLMRKNIFPIHQMKPDQ